MFCGLSVFNIRVLCVRRHRFLINVDSLSLVLVLLWAVGYVPANVQTRQSLGPLIIYDLCIFHLHKLLPRSEE